MPAQTVIKLRRSTAAQWTTADSTLAAGEAGFESDSNKLKIGDGSTAWSSLDYFGGGASVEVGDAAPSSPDPNTLWWDSVNATLYIYYDNFWVQAVTGVTGAQGPAGTDGVIQSATAPVDTDVLWIDTSAAGSAANLISADTVTTAGDLIVADGASSVTRLGVGTADQVLTTDGTDVSWSSPNYVPAAGTDGQVLTLASGTPAWADSEITTFIADATTARTLTSSDAKKTIQFTSGSATVVTVNASTDFPVGAKTDIIADGAGELTFTASGATIAAAETSTTTGSFTIGGQYSVATLLCVATDEYRLIGNIAVV